MKSVPRISDAKQKLIYTALRLFRQQGYHATGLSQLLEESGTPKGSFYHHFPGGKEGLAVAAVEQAGRDIETLMQRAFERQHDPGEGIRDFTLEIGRWFEASDFRAGCPITTVLLETVPVSEPLRVSCQEVYSRWEATLAQHFREEGVNAGAGPMATAAIAAIEGAWVLSRAQRTTSPFDAVAEVLAQMVRSAVT